MARANRQVKSANRVLELLEWFADHQRPATIKEISHSLGYPQSSTSHLLASLRDAGYFDHDALTGLYIPNVRLSLVTAWVEEQLYSEQSLMRLMHRVHDACGHTVAIGKLHNAQVRYLHVLQATRSSSFTAKIGSLRPLFLSASGMMLLTTKPEREIAGLLRRANALEPDPKRQQTLQAALQVRQQAIRQGWALSSGASTPGAAALAILLPVPRHHDALTLSVGGPIAEIRRDQRRLRELLNESVEAMRPIASR